MVLGQSGIELANMLADEKTTQANSHDKNTATTTTTTTTTTKDNGKVSATASELDSNRPHRESTGTLRSRGYTVGDPKLEVLPLIKVN